MQQCIYKGFCSAGLLCDVHPEDKSDFAAVAARLRGVAGACRARPKQAKTCKFEMVNKRQGVYKLIYPSPPRPARLGGPADPD